MLPFSETEVTGTAGKSLVFVPESSLPSLEKKVREMYRNWSSLLRRADQELLSDLAVWKNGSENH